MSAIRVVSPNIQKAWSWPAVMLFTMVGLGCGLYLSSALVSVATHGIHHVVGRPMSFGLFSVLIVIAGFFFVLIEAGRPLRAGRVFMNLRHSWMSRELMSLAAFLLAAVGDTLCPSWALKALALGGAFMLILSQGCILCKSKGMTAWNVPMMPALMVLSGIASGCGILLFSIRSFQALENAILIALVFCGANLVASVVYLYWKCDGAFLSATKRLRHPFVLFLNVGLGQVVPFVFLVFLVLLVENIEEEAVIITASGIMLMIGGFFQKTGIVLGAGYSREIVFNV